ncbi:hypothetical protein PUR59_00060, partial [Streptomyces sp. SP18ES09]|uniref:hypothetical protein n=1 Tax=Streptomyces sp. SP18ES09 TaxID=3002532 RepID=UPI002E786D1B
ETALFKGQWGLKDDATIETEGRPRLRALLDRIHDRRREGSHPLQRLRERFAGAPAQALTAGQAAELLALPLDERLKRRSVDGEKHGLEADLDEALTARPAL